MARTAGGARGDGPRRGRRAARRFLVVDVRFPLTTFRAMPGAHARVSANAALAEPSPAVEGPFSTATSKNAFGGPKACLDAFSGVENAGCMAET
jgi:hypothetical protein